MNCLTILFFSRRILCFSSSSAFFWRSSSIHHSQTPFFLPSFFSLSIRSFSNRSFSNRSCSTLLASSANLYFLSFILIKILLVLTVLSPSLPYASEHEDHFDKLTQLMFVVSYFYCLIKRNIVIYSWTRSFLRCDSFIWFIQRFSPRLSASYLNIWRKEGNTSGLYSS